MVLLKVTPTPYMQRIATLLKDAAYEIYQAVQRLQKNPSVAIDHAQRAKALENRVEVYRKRLPLIYRTGMYHIVEMLKFRENRHLSDAVIAGMKREHYCRYRGENSAPCHCRPRRGNPTVGDCFSKTAMTDSICPRTLYCHYPCVDSTPERDADASNIVATMILAPWSAHGIGARGGG
jgi:hypothetical protein